MQAVTVLLNQAQRFKNHPEPSSPIIFMLRAGAGMSCSKLPAVLCARSTNKGFDSRRPDLLPAWWCEHSWPVMLGFWSTKGHASNTK